MNWSNAEYDRLNTQQYEAMDPATRIEILKQMQAIMYAEQPMIVLDYPSILQAVNTSRWDGWAPYVSGSVWDNMINRQSYLEVKPKVAAAAATDQGSSPATVWIIVAVAAALVIGVALWLVRRGRRRALEE